MGINAGIAMLNKTRKFETEIFDRYRVFREAYTDRKFRTQHEMVELLIKCINEAIEEYNDTKEVDEFSYRIYWLQKCLSKVEDKEEKEVERDEEIENLKSQIDDARFTIREARSRLIELGIEIPSKVYTPDY